MRYMFFITFCLLLSLFLYEGQKSALTNMSTEFPKPWPPQMDQPYPDLTLIDQDGTTFHLSDFKGKVIIIEPVGMNCPSCQAFSGAHTFGPFQNNAVEKGNDSFYKIFSRYAPKLKLPRHDLIFVQILLYDMKLNQPTSLHAQIWAEHFHLKKSNNHYVTVSPIDLRGQASYNMVPGFQLIDRNFILRADSTGHQPKTNLYTTLIPMVTMALD